MDVPTLLTLITILSAVVAIFGTLYKLRSEKRNLDENADKTQTEVSSLLAESTKMLLEPMTLRILALERENRTYMEEAEALRREVIEVNKRIDLLNNKILDAENYIVRLTHQILSFDLTPISRDKSEICKE